MLFTRPALLRGAREDTHVLHLGPQDVVTWNGLLPEVLDRGSFPGGAVEEEVQEKHLGAFRFFAGSTLAIRADPRATRWFEAGADVEGDDLRASEYLSDVFERTGHLEAPANAFADPRAYTHFTAVPAMRAARAQFVSFAVDTLPPESGALRVLDVGCGDGGIVSELLPALLEAGRWDEVASITLLDPSPEMISTAKARLAAEWPGARVEGRLARLEHVASGLSGPFDLAIGSLSLHHMPAEMKGRALAALASSIDHLLLLELDADHDSPEVGSPRLAASIHHSYGWLLAQVLGPGDPDEVARESADQFVAPELVSLLTQPRGTRTEYHMRRDRWLTLLAEAMGPEIRPLGTQTALATPYVDLFALHMGRLG